METDDGQDLAAAERKARRLLWWATVLAFVAIIVCGLDIMIKNQILKEAKESQGWLQESAASLDRLRKDIAYADLTGEGRGSGADDGAADYAGDTGLAGVDGIRTGAQPDAGPDAGS